MTYHSSLDFPDSHSPGVKRQNLVVKTPPAGLMLRDELGLKGPMPVPGNLDGQLAQFPLERQVGGQAVLGRQNILPTPWLTERHGYDPTSGRKETESCRQSPSSGFDASG